MPYIISFNSQKGGVGKTTLARALAVELSKRKFKVKVADMDLEQGTFLNWYRIRLSNEIEPTITSVEPYKDLRSAVESSADYDFLILDTPGRALADSVATAQVSHIVIQPTSVSGDDLPPAVLRFHELVKKGVPKEKLYVVFKDQGSESEFAEATEYLDAAGYNYISTGLQHQKAYRQAQNKGYAFQEVKFKTLCHQVDLMLNEILEKLQEITEAR